MYKAEKTVLYNNIFDVPINALSRQEKYLLLWKHKFYCSDFCSLT